MNGDGIRTSALWRIIAGAGKAAGIIPAIAGGSVA